ncbi:hypothetical protein [Brevundimonas naejangsanensis]
MILKGSQRGGEMAMGRHLLKPENEHVEVHEVSGFIASDVLGAMKEVQALKAARGIEGDRRAVEAEAYAHMARRRAMMIERHYLEQDALGDLGNARLANLDDAEKAGLLNPAGWYLGVMQRRFLFLNADGHNLIYARTGGGKGTTSALPNLAHCRSFMFVIDVKDAELASATAAHIICTEELAIVALGAAGDSGVTPRTGRRGCLRGPIWRAASGFRRRASCERASAIVAAPSSTLAWMRT